MPNAMPTALRRMPARALYSTGKSPSRPPLGADLDLPHPMWWRVVKALASLWPFVRTLLDTVIVGGTVGGLALWVAATVGFPLPNPRALPGLGALLARPQLPLAAALALLALGLVSWRASVAWRAMAAGGMAHPDYLLGPVGRIAPATLVPGYIAGVYAARRDAAGDDLDERARAALRAAATGRAGAPLGICVYGRPGQGKTRLAWEAAASALLGWTLLHWPHAASDPFDLARVRGRRVILWLDDLQDYAAPGQASVLRDLPRLLRRACRGVVVVATCRDGADEDRARAALGSLMTQLRTVRPTDLPAAQAERLASALARDCRVHLHPDDFDGTPGSLLLGSASARAEAERQLPADAWRALRALRLLRAAGIHTYAERRVRATAEDVFGLERAPHVWPAARDALVAAGIVRVAGRQVGPPGRLDPVSQGYLTEPALDAGAPEWRSLRTSLAEHRDAHGLLTLGNTYRERAEGDARANSHLAETCYRGALAIYSPRIAPEAWASAQNNLAITLMERARAAGAPARERVAALTAAVAAYQAAERAYRARRAWGDCARVRTALGLALREQAGLAADAGRRRALLGAAAESFRAADRVRTHAVDPAVHALARAGLQAVARERRLPAVLTDDETPAAALAPDHAGEAAFDRAPAFDAERLAPRRVAVGRIAPLAGIGLAEMAALARARGAGAAARVWRSARATGGPLTHSAVTTVVSVAQTGLAAGARHSRRLMARAGQLTHGRRAAPVGMLSWAERASAAHARPIGTSTRLAGPLADFAAIAVAIDTPARAAGMPSVRRTDDGASLLVPVVTESHDSTADPGAEGTAETETETETESAAERALQLDDAIAAYRAELADASRTLDPMVRARARLDLAETLVGRAELVEGAGCVLLLREAVAECAAAESVFAARSADDWRRYATDLHAAIQGALADAERDAGHAAEDMGGHVAGPAGAALAENAAAGAGAARAGVLTVIPESPPSTERAGLVLAAPADDLAPLALVPTEDAHAGASADLAPAAVAVDAESDALPPYVGGASGLDATDIVWEVYEVYDDELDDADGDDLLAARPRP